MHEPGKKQLSTGCCIILLTAAAMIFGCMGSYGKLVSNPVTLDLYRHRTLPADLHYYYCGRSDLPYAVVGINSTYLFNDRLWFKIESMDQVYDKIKKLSDLHPGATTMKAADIMGPGGDRIGVWFSFYHHTPVQIDPHTRQLEIFNPYDPNEDDQSRIWN
ncbi:MAG: hypothetical protein K9K40_10290 [Desulfotignum sp.]|nr:hypothetical protein [Desulfotignum sp.]MCF8126024.1 hypothetical protein [Desulfotignum sp.]